MSWKEITERAIAFEHIQQQEQLQRQEQERLKKALEEAERDRAAEDILKRLEVAQALEDVGRDVWGEGSVTQTRDKRGWVLKSDPVATLQKPDLGDYLREKDRQVISLVQGRISLSIGVGFENGDPAMPKLIITDISPPSLLKENFLKKEKSDMQGVLRDYGWKKLVGKIQEELKLNVPWAFGGSTEEIRDLSGKNASERFNSSLITIVNRRIGKSSLPGQVRDSWGPLIDQFPHQHLLREHGSLTVADMQAWERAVRGPNILERAGSLFSGKPSQPTKI